MGNTSKEDVKKILETHNLGVKLDIGCGANKQEGFIGMDIRQLDGVDIVHNIEQYPWPFPDESVSLSVASHVLEHINPASTDARLSSLIDLIIKKGIISKEDIFETVGEHKVFGGFMRFMDEVWRITKENGQFMFVVPYAGSQGFWQDPTHINPISEATMFYFDPEHSSGLWGIYKPKPWKILINTWQQNGNLEVGLQKRSNLQDYYEKSGK